MAQALGPAVSVCMLASRVSTVGMGAQQEGGTKEPEGGARTKMKQSLLFGRPHTLSGKSLVPWRLKQGARARATEEVLLSCASKAEVFPHSVDHPAYHRLLSAYNGKPTGTLSIFPCWSRGGNNPQYVFFARLSIHSLGIEQQTNTHHCHSNASMCKSAPLGNRGSTNLIWI